MHLGLKRRRRKLDYRELLRFVKTALKNETRNNSFNDISDVVNDASTIEVRLIPCEPRGGLFSERDVLNSLRGGLNSVGDGLNSLRDGLNSV